MKNTQYIAKSRTGQLWLISFLNYSSSFKNHFNVTFYQATQL
jgi:hypothetical protein